MMPDTLGDLGVIIVNNSSRLFFERHCVPGTVQSTVSVFRDLFM